MRRGVRFDGPGELTVERDAVPEPGPGEVLVETAVSAVSPGTELLVYRGEVPADLPVDESLPALAGTFSYPLRYGYAAVGEVVDRGDGVDPGLAGRTVFGFNPHESHFVAAADDVHPVPEGIDPGTAALFPTAETAVTLVMDAAPVVGEHVAVFGQGLVGLLTTALLSSFPLGSLTAVDPVVPRRRLGLAFGADRMLEPGAVPTAGDGETSEAAASDVHAADTAEPTSPVTPHVDTDGGDEVSGRDDVSAEHDDVSTEHDGVSEGRAGDGPTADGFDLAVELSGDPAALDEAIEATGYGGRVVVGSWYGTKRADLGLGGRFHRSRISLRASQVSTIDPSFRGRWDRTRRATVAWDHLRELPLDDLPTRRLPVERAAEGYELLASRPDDAVTVLFTYD